MGEWDTKLEVASFGGIEFEVLSVSDGLGRRIVEHEYPYRNGADLEDTGRRARPSSFRAIFHGDGYLSRLVELQRLIDAGETRALRHPLFGQWQAKAVDMTVDHDSSRRDAAEVQIEFREDGTSTTIPLIETVAKSEQKLTDGLADLTTACEDLDETPAAVTSFQSDAGEYLDDLEEGVDSRETRFDQLDAYARAAVDGLDDLGDDVSTGAAIRAIRKVQLAARAAREAYDANQPSIVDLDLPADSAITAVATRLYGDPDRAAELQRLNKIRNPFILPGGTRLRVHGS